jgi:hypothetical protein
MSPSDGPDDRPGSFSADNWQPRPQGPVGGGAPDAPDTAPGVFNFGDRPAPPPVSPSQGVRISVPSAAELLLGIPWALWSFGVVSSVASWFSQDWLSLTIVVAWVLSGLVIVWPGTEDLIVKYLYRLRRPTLLEQQKLDVSWRAVCGRAGVDPTCRSDLLQTLDRGVRQHQRGCCRRPFRGCHAMDGEQPAAEAVTSSACT